ncbi:MAG: hypothetical protein HN846_00410 [Candidatus Pacebacteria bacterium]|nr:hypothetical protein [Candidatus Paceibacterota bacterium]MBT4358565.1 hypothetical protein [Candidatus Paceibacterota bacterium]MBT4680505.1 hypothetical protein [Candidatus Paceibacterota bacterium]MBT6898834.1 hypothetical protein [Candidatus Paceibacterota bacterium]MBT7309167.1 hypothetical protein [Candidatus Paceibacterota bacterium]
MFNSNLLLKFIGYLFYPFYFLITYFVLDYHIEPMVSIGGGLFLHNRDIVITDRTEIGKNFSIMGHTTIATDFDAKDVLITIGDNVKIGTGARVIAKGKLKIADGVIIGANAVVTKSLLKKNSVYAGIPAKFIKKRS